MAICWRLLRRNTIGLVRFVVSIAALYPLALFGGDMRPALAVVGVLAASVAVGGVADMARRFQGDRHLRAHLGLDTRSSRNTALIAPTIMAALWAVLVAPAMAGGGTTTSAHVSALSDTASSHTDSPGRNSHPPTPWVRSSPWTSPGA